MNNIFNEEIDSVVENCLGYEDYLNLKNNSLFIIPNLDKYFYENIARNSKKVFENFILLNREIQLNISKKRLDIEKKIEIDENLFDLMDIDLFVPAFSYLKRLIFNQYSIKNPNLFYVIENEFVFLIREESNECDIINYDNCEEIDPYTKRKIFNAPFKFKERWTTFYLVNAFLK